MNESHDSCKRCNRLVLVAIVAIVAIAAAAVLYIQSVSGPVPSAEDAQGNIFKSQEIKTGILGPNM